MKDSIVIAVVCFCLGSMTVAGLFICNRLADIIQLLTWIARDVQALEAGL